MAPTLSFRRRRGVAPSTFVPSSTSMPALPLDSPCIEDKDVSLHDANLRSRKRKVIDKGDDIPVVINLLGTSPEAVDHGLVVMPAEGMQG